MCFFKPMYISVFWFSSTTFALYMTLLWANFKAIIVSMVDCSVFSSRVDGMVLTDQTTTIGWETFFKSFEKQIPYISLDILRVGGVEINFIVLLSLLLLFGRSNYSTQFYPLSFKSSWYGLISDLKTFSLAEIVLSLLFTAL